MSSCSVPVENGARFARTTYSRSHSSASYNGRHLSIQIQKSVKGHTVAVATVIAIERAVYLSLPLIMGFRLSNILHCRIYFRFTAHIYIYIYIYILSYTVHLYLHPLSMGWRNMN